MPDFSLSSARKLLSCHKDLQVLFREVVKVVDCTVIYGHRSIEEQQALYAQGRTKPGRIVTNCDGINKKSKHNDFPSLAVDVIPYPIDWNDEQRIIEFGNYVMKVADRLYREGAITHRIEWGGLWEKFKDLPHYQIYEK